jgi:Mycoplasma protein of unknown function, DUF285
MNAEGFQGIGVELWNVSKVKLMSVMFDNASSFDANLSLWDVSNVHDMTKMFANTMSFQGQGLENWNMSQVNQMRSISESSLLFHSNLSNWDMSCVLDMRHIFRNASSFPGVDW